MGRSKKKTGIKVIENKEALNKKGVSTTSDLVDSEILTDKLILNQNDKKTVIKMETEVDETISSLLDNNQDDQVTNTSSSFSINQGQVSSSELWTESTSVEESESQQESSNVEKWLKSTVIQQKTSTAMAPATTGDAVAAVKGQTTANKNLKGQVCTHLVKAISMPGVRKALKGDIKGVCSKAPCKFEGSNSTPNLKWMCLQCGNIGCGNITGQYGHAKLHYETPHSDMHNIAVLFQGSLDKAWCFECKFELDTSTSYFKDVIPFLRRNPRVKSALTNNSAVSHVPIALGPPPPPPVPKIDPPKPFPLRGKQNQNRIATTSSNYSTSRWDSGDWPLGLENLGNTCFMNSALQCLSRTRSLNNKLDLYGAGNVIEILVTPDEPYVKVINTKVEEGGESDFTSDECERFIERGLEGNNASSAVDSSDLESGGLSPSSTEMDSLLDVASGSSSSKSDGSGDAVDKEQWTQELEQELRKPLRLRLSISKESMAAKLRHCFRAITRTPDNSAGGDSYDRSEFYCRGNNLSTVFSPRAVQLSVSRHFRLGQQHDSHELLRTVVDMMKKDQIKAFRLAIMQRYGVKKSEGKNCDPKVAELLKMWDRKLYHKTFVDEIFGGELVTFQECLQCKSVRRSHEEFLDISLPIRVFRANPNPSKKSYSLFDEEHNYVINRSVEDCLRAYTEPEFLTGSNVVECENCHRINLERLAAGVDFDEVFPGMNNGQKSGENNTTTARKSTYPQKNHNKKRQSRQAKIKSKLNQSDFVLQENSDMGTGSSLKIVEDHFKNDPSKSLVDKSACGTSGGEEDAKSSKSGSLDDYVFIQSTPMVVKQETENCKNGGGGQTAMDMDFQPDLRDYYSTGMTDEKGASGDDNKEGTGNSGESNLSRGLSTSIKSLSLIENGMDVDVGRPLEEDEEMTAHDLDQNDDEDMDDLDEPAVDGIGNASDIEDEDGGNGLPHLDLGFMEDKPLSVADYLAVPATSDTRSSTVGDEGFSEGENSLEEKNSQSLSGSSSRNSISEADNITDTVDNNNKTTTTNKIPVTKCPCSRRQLISRPPECLTLHLKRFQHTGRGSSKLGDTVNFPYILNLTEFCSEAEEDLSKPGYKTIFDEDGEVIYSLYGIVEHSGSLHFGHYVAYVKVEGKREGDSGERAADKWFYISDSHVSSSSLKSVLRQDAYILFYERIRGAEKKERLLQFSNLNSGDVPSYSSSGGYNNEASNNTDADGGWSSTVNSYTSYNNTYDKPATVSIGPQWNNEENWEEEDSTTQQVSSSNDPSSINYNAEVADPVSSSSTLSYQIPLHGIIVDGVVSSTTTDATMDYCGPVNASTSSTTSSSSHPLWNEDDVQKGSALFDDIPDLMDDSASTNNAMSTYEAVSSSSDITLNNSAAPADAYTKLEDVD